MEFTTLHIKSFGTQRVKIKEVLAGECKIYGEIGQTATTIANKIFIEWRKQNKMQGKTNKGSKVNRCLFYKCLPHSTIKKFGVSLQM